METLARILSKDERKTVRYIRKEDIIPKGYKYDGMVEIGEVEPIFENVIEISQYEQATYNMDPGKGGIKNDDGKNRLELIHPDLLFAIGEVMTLGALKYDDWNWYKGMSWARVYGSMERHMKAWYRGDEHDDESGKPHLWHAACCLMFLIVYQEQQKGRDDRPK